MTMDRTLKVHGGLLRSRSVLTRTERIEKLTEEGKFDPEANSPFGLPKVKIRQSKVGTKSKKAEEATEAVDGEAPADATAAETTEEKPKK